MLGGLFLNKAILSVMAIALIAAFVAPEARADEDCAVQADAELRKIYGLPDEVQENVCRYYGVLLMKSMLTDSGPFDSEKQQSKYERKARKTSTRAVKKCASKRKLLVRDCRAIAKMSDD